MRGLLGGIILVAGVGGLGWYAGQGPAVAMQAQIADAASNVAGSAQHAVNVAVSGRDVTVSGVIEDDAEREALAAAFDEIAGRRVVNMTDLEVLEVVSPFTLNVTKNAEGLQLAGFAPSQAAADALGADALEIANGEPDDAWGDAAATVTAAVAHLKTGVVQMSDSAVSVFGTAANPTDLAAFNDEMDALPEGYTITRAIDVEDDGTPLRLSLSYDGTTLSGSGKIPSDLALDDLNIGGGATQLEIQEGKLVSEDGAWPAAALAAVGALGAMESGTVAFEGQKLTLTGIATPDGIDAAAASLADLPDGYVAETQIMLSDDGTPFRLQVTSDGDEIVASGKVPADFEDTTDFLTGATSDDLEAAFITDDADVWPGIANAGLAALTALQSGTLDIADNAITLTGEAFSPVERDIALEELAGYDATTEIALLDDGAPLSLAVTYSVDTGVDVSGKLPSDVALADVADVLDLDVTDAGATQATLPSTFDMLAPLAAIKTFLPELSGLTYTAAQNDVSFDAVTVPGVDPGQIGDAMQAALGSDVNVAVTERTDLPANGTTRTNRFSGRTEVFTSGFWLPSFDFFATPESCTEQSNIVLAQDQVQFLTGSADLDVASIRAINALSALARKCALEGGVFLQVAGHTDNTGDADANVALSQARADAVRDAILDRGLARAVVTAIGFGDAQPIADNETEEGRAANRRTEFNWNFE